MIKHWFYDKYKKFDKGENMIFKIFLFLLKSLCAEGAGDNKDLTLLGIYEFNLLSVATFLNNSWASMTSEGTFLNFFFSLSTLWFLMILSFSIGLSFYGIMEPRHNVSFFLGVFYYTLMSYFSDSFKSLGELVSLSEKQVMIIISTILATVSCAFYKFITFLFTGMVIFLLYTGVSGKIVNTNFFINLLVLIAVCALTFKFKKFFNKIFIFILLPIFASYGTLLLLTGLSSITSLPPGFIEFIGDLAGAKSAFEGLANPNVFVWLIAAVGSGFFQLFYYRKNHKNKGKDDSDEDKKEEK